MKKNEIAFQILKTWNEGQYSGNYYLTVYEYEIFEYCGKNFNQLTDKEKQEIYEFFNY
jgi:hypothetical protein